MTYVTRVYKAGSATRSVSISVHLGQQQCHTCLVTRVPESTHSASLLLVDEQVSLFQREVEFESLCLSSHWSESVGRKLRRGAGN